MSLSVRIVVGLFAGIGVGLVLGEPAGALQPVADIYIRLMQMTVLPYMVMALVVGFGQLDPADAKRLWGRAGIMLLVVWLVTAAVIAAMPLTFPKVESASFFSSSLVEPHQTFSVADLYFTSNPFHSLANAVVPAVVLFSSLVGIFLMGVEGKGKILEPLRLLGQVIERMTRWVISLTPYGVAAIAAVTAGTMTLETFARLEVYFLAFAAAALLLAFGLLPLLVTTVTPFRYRDVVGASRDALLTAFVTSNAFVVLPLLLERTRTLLRARGIGKDGDSAADLLVPILFNFPNAGRLLTLLFVPFAAWLAGSALSPRDYATLFGVGIPSYFAKAQVALPYLLDLFDLPHDLFQLYIPSSILTGKLDSVVTAMNLFVFGLLGAAAMGGILSLHRRALTRAAAVAAGALVVTVLGVGLLAHVTLGPGESPREALRRMHLARETAPAVVHRAPYGLPGPGEGATATERMRSRGTLRVGYDPGNAPFSFFNEDGQLVGFDVELAFELADALELEPEFVPVVWSELPDMLEDGRIDVMPSVWYRPYWFASLRLSRPYLMGTVGLVTRDENRQRFSQVATLRRTEGLRIGIPLDTRQLRYSMEQYFGPDVEFVVFDRPGEYFEVEHPDVDAFLMPAETASAATLLHPEFTVVVPQPDPVRIPFAFGLPLDAPDLLGLVDEWVLFAENEGTVRRAYDHWVLGRGAAAHGRRWSIARDVLGWMD